MIHHNKDDQSDPLTPAEFKVLTEEALDYQEKLGFTKGYLAAYHKIRCTIGVTLDEVDQAWANLKEQEKASGK